VGAWRPGDRIWRAFLYTFVNGRRAEGGGKRRSGLPEGGLRGTVVDCVSASSSSVQLTPEVLE
jgi:hypothetical protein